MGGRSGLSILLVVATAILAGAVPGSAVAHPAVPKTAADHMQEDAVVHTPAEERRLERQTAAATESDVELAAAAAAGDASEIGEWGPVLDWPVVGIHVALLENGKVLAYDNVGDLHPGHYEDHNQTRATVWDPDTGVHTSAWLMGFNIFCSGLGHLMDGTLFTAGGNLDAGQVGLKNTYTFDSETNTWDQGDDMVEARWYPSVTPLRNGEMLITDGVEGRAESPEVRATDGALRSLTGASKDLPLYPWMDLAPDGRVFNSGPTKPMRRLDPTGSGSWKNLGDRDAVARSYGGHALYDVGKILVAGGGPSTPSAVVIDINGSTPQISPTASMAYGRRQHNLTVLADGTVLATGGNSSGAFHVDMNAGVYPAELWDPATGLWTTLAPMQVTRQYHSTALLLPDGRVLSAGGGVCGTCEQVGYLAKNAEVFTPPYLFRDDGSGELAPRPQVTSAPGVVSYGQAFPVGTPGAGSISKVAMVRLGAVTHSVNMEQRYVPLEFTASGSTITANAPSNPNVAPPGVYMLFVIGADGVPSVAEMVRIEAGASGPPAPTITDTDPDSPSKINDPEVKGVGAAAGSTVRVYGDSGCSGPVLGSGTAAAFNGAVGVTAVVPPDQTTNLRVTATAQGNPSACSAPFPYTEDSTPPNTLFTQQPPATTTNRTVTFAFTATEPSSTFRCRMDSEVFAPCTSPVTRTVGVGAHVFRVRGIDPSNNFDDTPARANFRVN